MALVYGLHDVAQTINIDKQPPQLIAPKHVFDYAKQCMDLYMLASDKDPRGPHLSGEYCFREILSKFPEIDITKTCLHLCEAPGGFINVTHESNWHAVSLQSGVSFLGKHLLCKKKNGHSRVIHAGNGNVCSDTVRKCVLNECDRRMVLITGDGPPDTTAKNCLSIAFRSLVDDASLVLRLNKATSHLAYVCDTVFKKTSFIRPRTLSACSDDFYMVCTGFFGPGPTLVKADENINNPKQLLTPDAAILFYQMSERATHAAIDLANYMYESGISNIAAIVEHRNNHLSHSQMHQSHSERLLLDLNILQRQ